MVGYVLNPILYNRVGDSFSLYPSAAPADNEAVFTVDPSSWDSLATVPVADEQFETNGRHRARFMNVQYAPRIVSIAGIIHTPKPDNAAQSATNRRILLNSLYTLLGAMQKEKGLLIQFSYTGDYYWLFCHPHGGDAVRVKTDTDSYIMSISLIAEDPLMYRTDTITVSSSANWVVKNPGQVPVFAEVKANARDMTGITSITNGTDTLHFRSWPMEYHSLVSWPGQRLTVGSDSTPLSNINTATGVMFLKAPVGSSTWNTSWNVEMGITIRPALLALAP